VIEEHFRELAELVRGLAILGELTPRSVDAISSFGERISSRLVAIAFRNFGIDAVHVDSREVIKTDARHTQAAPLYEPTYARLAELVRPLAERQTVVMGGFIGSTLEGVTTTLGRGGSDFSASIVGAGIGAEEIQIWTDVDGMLTCDPRILPIGRRSKPSLSPKPPNWPTSGPKCSIRPPSCRLWRRISRFSSSIRAGRRWTARALWRIRFPARKRRQIHRLQTEHYGDQHPVLAHAHGLWLPAQDLRSIRPFRHAGGFGDHLRG
jgi:hypothetical protein